MPEKPHPEPQSRDLPEASLGIHRENLKPEVKRYTDNLASQVTKIFEEVGVSSIDEFTDKYSKQEISSKDAERVEKLLEALAHAAETNSVPESAREVSLDQAREAIGKESFLGPQEVEKALDIKIDQETIPEIPFSPEELQRAKELNQFLILRVDRFTTKELHECYKTLHAVEGEPLLYDPDWYKDEPFYTKEKPKLSWALVSREVVPNTTSKNYLEQTQELINYLKTEVYKGQPLPADFDTWVAEFDSQKDQIASVISSDWQTASQKLSNLQITQQYRQSFADAVYDLAIYHRTFNDRLLPNIYGWTNSRSSVGKLVLVGLFESDGVYVDVHKPALRVDYLGSAFSRNL